MSCILDSELAGKFSITIKFQISEDGLYVTGHTKKGEAFIFDVDDLDIVSKFSWYISKRGYVVTTINHRAMTMHKILLGNTNGFDVDHISRDRLDNRKSNLRLCSHQENAFNQKKRKTNTSGYIGVSFLKAARKFEAYVHFNGKKHHFGLHETAFDAAIARDNGASKLFGKYANLNLTPQIAS